MKDFFGVLYIDLYFQVINEIILDNSKNDKYFVYAVSLYIALIENNQNKIDNRINIIIQQCLNCL